MRVYRKSLYTDNFSFIFLFESSSKYGTFFFIYLCLHNAPLICSVQKNSADSVWSLSLSLSFALSDRFKKQRNISARACRFLQRKINDVIWYSESRKEVQLCVFFAFLRLQSNVCPTHFSYRFLREVIASRFDITCHRHIPCTQ